MNRRGAPTWSLVTAGVLALGLATGCENHQTRPEPSPAPPPPEPVSQHLNHAQPKLRTVPLFLGPHEITAEVALTPTEVATGMMFRKNMEENEGMLFVFYRPHQASFYMKNTSIPLSAAYIDPEGNILEIRRLNPHDLSPVEAQSDEVQYVLEMNQGWFQRHSITVGAYIRTDKGSLSETFFPGR